MNGIFELSLLSVAIKAQMDLDLEVELTIVIHKLALI